MPNKSVSPLEKEFHKAMVAIYIRAENEANYTATRFLQMVNELGGLAAAKRLINSEVPSEGYTALWERGRLDITVEALVQNPQWSSLFSPEEIEKAQKRLLDYNYKI